MINNIIPVSCISLKEQSKYISNAIMENYNEFIEDIANKELDSFKENNTNIKYDDNKMDELKESIENLHMNNLSIIKESYEGILGYFNSLLESSEDLYVDIQDKSYGKIHEFKNVNNVDYSKNSSNFIAALNKTFAYAIENNLSSDYVKNDLIKEFENNICESISNTKSITINEMNDNLKDYLCGNCVEVNKNFLENNCESMNNTICTDYILDRIEEAFNQEYDTIVGIIENIDNLSENYMDFMDQYNKIACLAEAVMTDCYFNRFDAYNRMINEYRNVAIKTSYLNEFSIIRSRKSKQSYAKKKRLGVKYDTIKALKAKLRARR